MDTRELEIFSNKYVGKTIKIKFGAFENMIGRCVEVDSMGDLIIALPIFGAVTKITIEMKHAEIREEFADHIRKILEGY